MSAVSLGWPQIALLAFLFGNSLLVGIQHGKPRIGKNNLLLALITDVVVIGILWAGGFFTGASVGHVVWAEWTVVLWGAIAGLAAGLAGITTVKIGVRNMNRAIKAYGEAVIYIADRCSEGLRETTVQRAHDAFNDIRRKCQWATLAAKLPSDDELPK